MGEPSIGETTIIRFSIPCVLTIRDGTVVDLDFMPM